MIFLNLVKKGKIINIHETTGHDPLRLTDSEFEDSCEFSPVSLDDIGKFINKTKTIGYAINRSVSFKTSSAALIPFVQQGCE